MAVMHNNQTYGLGAVECCPECSHSWTPYGPAHFNDCRYFSLDDDRDEEPPVRLWALSPEMLVAEMQNGTA